MDFYGWKIKTWRLNQVEEKNAWIKIWQNKYQIREIFVCNKLAVEYRLLLHK